MRLFCWVQDSGRRGKATSQRLLCLQVVVARHVIDTLSMLFCDPCRLRQEELIRQAAGGLFR
jgi:hypothetical protein